MNTNTREANNKIIAYTLDEAFIEKMFEAMKEHNEKIRFYLTDSDSEWHEWYSNLYEKNADMYEWSEFIENFRHFLGMDRQSPIPFDELWQRHTLLNENPETAIQEFIDFINGN